MSTNPFAGWTEKEVKDHNRRVETQRLERMKSDLRDAKVLERDRLAISKDISTDAKTYMDEIPHPKIYSIPPYVDATPYFDLNRYEREVKSFSVPLTIIGAKRMTQADKSLRRPAIRAYMEFRNKLVELAGKYPVPDLLNFKCWIPMPESWSKRKKASMDGQPHKQRPDLDNAAKCLMDTLFEGNDSGVFGTEGQFKFWCRQGKQKIDVELVYLKEK